MLATLADVLNFKPIEGDKSLLRVLLALRAVDAWARIQIGEDPEIASQTERASGGGGYASLLYLKRWPILSVSALDVAGSTWTLLSESGADSGQQAMIGDGGLWLESRFEPWPAGKKNIQVTYSAGFSAAELYQVKVAVCMGAHLLLNESNFIGLGQRTIGEMQVQQIVRNSKDYQFMTEALSNLRRTC